MNVIAGHLYTKYQAVIAFVRGNQGQARILWRWMRNRPTAHDIEKIKRRIRGDVRLQEEIRRLNEQSQEAKP